MKLKAVISVMMLGLGINGIAYANYIPPERLECSLVGGKVNCEGFNRQYLTEHIYSANFEAGKEKILTFKSAVAYFTPNQTEWTVLVTYKDLQNKEVLLKTVNYSIKPDLKNGDWERVKNEFYTCGSGYMSCSLTNLPTLS
jgi:hypothetical protein